MGFHMSLSASVNLYLLYGQSMSNFPSVSASLPLLVHPSLLKWPGLHCDIDGPWCCRMYVVANCLRRPYYYLVTLNGIWVCPFTSDL